MENEEFEERVVAVDRVTRVQRGGKRLSFRALVVVGNKAGKVGIGQGKASEVTEAVLKAVSAAKKNLSKISLTESTIPHEVKYSFKGAAILLKPAKPGTGIIAGGLVRPVVELAGIKDIVAKIQGKTKNKINITKATFFALKSLRSKKEVEEERK